MGVPSQPIAVDWDDDGLTDLILAPEGRFFRRHGTGETEKDWAIGGAETGLVWCFCAPARARWYKMLNLLLVNNEIQHFV